MAQRLMHGGKDGKRTNCTDAEARDLSHVAMLACLFGCDALFEAGLIAVDPHCPVITSPTVPASAALAARLNDLRGRPVTAFTTGSAAYFAWHRGNTFQRS